MKSPINTGDVRYSMAFHAGNTGSNPVGDAKAIQGVSPFGLTPFFL